jgi:hypothetical protein
MIYSKMSQTGKIKIKQIKSEIFTVVQSLSYKDTPTKDHPSLLYFQYRFQILYPVLVKHA